MSLSDRYLDWKNLCVNKYCLTLFIHKTICCLRRNLSFSCSVISQGKVVALDRWGGKWNHLSMTSRLTTDCAKNYCNRTLVVKVIVENVVTCFYGTQCISCPYFWHVSTIDVLAIVYRRGRVHWSVRSITL